MPPPGSLALLRRAISQLRHVELADFIGQTVQISRPSTAHREVRESLASHISFSPTVLEGSAPELTVAKYGLLDLRYSTPLGATELPGLKGSALRKLDLQSDDQDLGEDALVCLEEIADETVTATCDLRVFLRAEEHSPSNHWPRTFVVEDACITNSPTLWLGQHFYL